jgi:hypothetical protein
MPPAQSQPGSNPTLPRDRSCLLVPPLMYLSLKFVKTCRLASGGNRYDWQVYWIWLNTSCASKCIHAKRGDNYKNANSKSHGRTEIVIGGLAQSSVCAFSASVFKNLCNGSNLRTPKLEGQFNSSVTSFLVAYLRTEWVSFHQRPRSGPLTCHLLERLCRVL